MRDPVILVQSGHTYDREYLCESLLRDRDLCPSTGKRFGEKIEYRDNLQIRQLLTLHMGQSAYQRYNDSEFRRRYAELWNDTEFVSYKTVASLLYGMNERQIDWVSAQRMAMNADKGDAIIAGFRSLLLHPAVFPCSRKQTGTKDEKNQNLLKNEKEAQLEWENAEDLGLSASSDSGNPWSQWLAGTYEFLVEQQHESAKKLLQLAANQGHALSQNTLGNLYEGDEQYERAEELYNLAAAQGHADAQYNLAMLYEPDFELMRPFLEQAAAQGHAEALYYLGMVYVDSDVVPHDLGRAKDYLRQAVEKGHAEAQSKLQNLPPESP